MGHFTYLTIDILVILFPLIFSFHPKLLFSKNWGAFWPACIVTAGFFLIWDAYYTKIGVWGFNPKYTMGVYLMGLPLEECLFFVCIPYASVFTYHCLNNLIAKDVFKSIKKYITWGLILLLILIAVFNINKLYTSVTFLLTAITLIILQMKSVNWLSRFYFSYAWVLMPFFLVNGILTGSLIDQPIVWYDNTQNLGIRLFTIPIEDVFYGMLLLLINTGIYEFLLSRKYASKGAVV